MQVLSSLSLPSSAIFAWLDSHVQVRLSILFAYLFGKSQLFMQLLRWLGHAWALLRTGLEPFVSFLGCVFSFHGFVAPYLHHESMPLYMHARWQRGLGAF